MLVTKKGRSIICECMDGGYNMQRKEGKKWTYSIRRKIHQELEARFLLLLLFFIFFSGNGAGEVANNVLASRHC